MQLVADLHIHTVASGHAYSTVLEILHAAADKKLAMVAITDHGPGMPGGAHNYHFGNLATLPSELFGVKIVKGIEANVMDREGSLDLEESRLARLDLVLAGLHTHCAPYGSIEENTSMMINAMKNPFVDCVVHPGNPEYPINKDAVVQAAAEHNIALEINNSSLTVSRKGSQAHCEKIALLAKQYRVKIIVGTDSHFALNIGNFAAALELLRRIDFPEELVLNTSESKIMEHLRRRSNRKQR